MTPNPNSPIFIKHEVPEYACENSKKLSQLFLLLREQIANNKWEGTTENDIDLTYNTYNGFTEVNIKFCDDNKHLHHFSMCLLPYNGWGNVEDDSFHLSYFFEGTFNENALLVRSFAEYLATYLGFEGFEPTLVKCDKGIWLESSLKYAYEDFCKLIDITISCLRPLEWFYSKEPKISRATGTMTTIKLDKNFDINIHGGEQYIVRGYDEDRGMYYYQLFFNEEK